MPGHGSANEPEGLRQSETAAVMEALEAMGSRLNQALDAFNKHLTTMDASIQHSEAVMTERLDSMAKRIQDLELKSGTPRPLIPQVISSQSQPLSRASAAKPSEHAMKSFLTLSTKSLSQHLKGSNTFASWQFALQVTLSIVNLDDYVMKNSQAPDWVTEHPELLKAAYLLIVRSISQAQISIIRNAAQDPRIAFRKLFEHNLGSSASMRDSRAKELRSIRCANKEMFANYASVITTRANAHRARTQHGS